MPFTDLSSLGCYNIVYAVFRLYQRAEFAFYHLSITGTLKAKCWSLCHSLSSVNHLQGTRQLIRAFCTELKTKPSQRWGDASCRWWVHRLCQGGSSQQVAVQQSPRFCRLFCLHRLLPQIEASYHLLVVHTSNLPVPKYFKLKKKLCFIHQMFYDIPRTFFEKNVYQQMCSVTSATV